MNLEITLDDYKSIGTMDTALSEHADEAFFELSPERQKIAERIFKCLTETDRENREIRRAMTIEKLCAVAEADFADVAAVIEVFRKEGRTFLMPPPEVSLIGNTLIDISHESLIRKWERLKKWVEEEGQSARTYRRLAEDALLHQQNKMGFWSDPELKDALEWRENFQPNETWAQLYKETGERQFRATFADSIKYLDESEINRDEEIAEDKRQQDALRSFAAKLRWAVIGLLILFTASLGAAIFAFNQRADAIRQRTDAVQAQGELSTSLKELRDSQEKLTHEKEDKENALKRQEEETKKAEDESKRADEQTRLAKLSELETQKALEKQKQLSAEAESAKNNAIERQKEAEIAQKQAEAARKQAEDALAEVKATAERVEINRTALVFLEQGEFERALPLFKKLLASYEDENQPMSKESRTDGKWWALHNLGIVNSKLNKFEEAESYYKKALQIFGEKPPDDIPTQSKYSRQYFLPVSYQTSSEVNRSKAATLRRLAQLYRSRVENSADEKNWEKFNLLAIKSYDRLLEITETETSDKKQLAGIYVELADALADSYDSDSYGKAGDYYRKALDIYLDNKDFAKIVVVFKKITDFELYQKASPSKALTGLMFALNVQEGEEAMNLSPVNLEIAETYDRIAKIAFNFGNESEIADAPLFVELSRLIGDLNFKANIKGEFSPADVRALADAYIKIGSCHRAEKVYFYAIDEINEPDEQSQSLHRSPVYPGVLNDLADFYQNVAHDGRKAQEYFDKFVVESEKGEYLKKANLIVLVNQDLYVRAGDFYLAQKNFAQAGKLYLDALKIIEAKLDRDKTNTKLIQAKAKILVKEADFYEAQNKPEEAEESYAKALDLVPLSVRMIGKRTDEIILRARILIQKADFYERHGNKEKMAAAYTEIDATLGDLDESENAAAQQTMSYIEEIHAVKGIIYKKLGDLSRDKVEIAADAYEKAVSHLEWFSNSSLKDKSIPYFKNNKLNAKYYSDLAEAYESWMSLSGVQLFPAQKSKAEEARKKADALKLEEQKSTCR